MGREGNFRHDIAVKSSSRGVEHLVGELADRQHGVVSRPQLLELGLGRGAILHRLELRRLRPVHRGVYAVGRGGLSSSGFWMAAVLACGPGASLSHRSGAALWTIRRRGSGWIEVTAPRKLGGREGIRSYRASLPPDEVTRVHGIPVTTAARTLLDLAAVVDRHDLRRALEQAEALRLGDITSLGCSPLPLPRPARDRGPEGDPPRRDQWRACHSQRARGALPGLRPRSRPADAGHQRRACAQRRVDRGRLRLARGTGGGRARWLRLPFDPGGVSP